jgi:rubrerythrin
VEEDESIVARYNLCLLDKAGATTDQAEARRVCMAETTDFLIHGEQVAQRQYGEFASILPERLFASKGKVLEIKSEEGTHEKELRQILMQVTMKRIPT